MSAEQLSNDDIHREKLRSLGHLSAGIAHELNNPIGYIASNINSLKKYIDSMETLINQAGDLLEAEQKQKWEQLKEQHHWNYIKSDIKDLVQETCDGADHLKHVVADLKTLGRSSTSPELISVDSCVRSALNVLTHQLKTHVHVKAELGSCAPQLLIRPQIIQALVNILHNAGQAITENGEILISTSDQDPYSVITIEDNGPGIPEQQQARIFDAYFTTKDSQEGSGLGLAIVQDILHKHRGDIRYSTGSHWGGACFTLRLQGAPDE